MKKTAWLILVLILTLTLVAFGGCSSDKEAAAPAPAETEQPAEAAAESAEAGIDMEYTEWTCPTIHTTSQIYYQHLAELADNVFERTDGKLRINVYAQGELPYDGYEFLQILENGDVEMCMPELGYVGGELPLMDIPSYPMLVSSNEQMLAALDASEPYWGAVLDEMGIMNLAYWSMEGMGIYGTGEAPQSFADLKGRTVRVYDTTCSDLLAANDVIPVSIAWAEVVPSLQRGVCDGAYTAIVSAYEAGFGEVIDWAYWCELVGCAGFVCISEDAFNSVPAEVQEILIDEGKILTEKSFAYNEENTQKDWDAFGEMGIELVKCSDEDYAMLQSQCEEIWLNKAAEAGDQGLECLQAIRDAVGK